MGKKSSKYAPSFNELKSVPTTELKHQDPLKILHSVPLNERDKQIMGPDPKEMVKLEKKKQERERAQKKLLGDKPEIPLKESDRRKAEEEVDNKSLPIDIYQDEQGRIRDKEGNILNLLVESDSQGKPDQQSRY